MEQKANMWELADSSVCFEQLLIFLFPEKSRASDIYHQYFYFSYFSRMTKLKKIA